MAAVFALLAAEENWDGQNHNLRREARRREDRQSPSFPAGAATEFEELLRKLGDVHYAAVTELKDARNSNTLLRKRLKDKKKELDAKTAAMGRVVPFDTKASLTDLVGSPSRSVLSGPQSCRHVDVESEKKLTESESICLPGMTEGGMSARGDGHHVAFEVTGAEAMGEGYVVPPDGPPPELELAPDDMKGRLSYVSRCESQVLLGETLGETESVSDASESDEKMTQLAKRLQGMEYEPRQVWKEGQNTTRHHQADAMRDLDSQIPTMHASEENGTVMPKVLTAGKWSRFISYPGGSRRLLWDLSGGFLILLDLIFIPLNVFDPPKNAVITTVDWTTLIFWTIDMFMSLQVGYVSEGVTIMIPHLILLNYMKTWFVVDLLVVAPDWIFTIIELASSNTDGQAGANSFKLVRIVRLVRSLRLLRMAKLKWIVQSITDRLDSEHSGIVFNIIKMICLLLAVNHIIACLWYLTSWMSGSNNWIRLSGFDTEEWTYKYMVSFHWSITQFTPSSMPVQPASLGERAFAIFIIVFALVGFSYIVGSISGSLAQLRALNEDSIKEFWRVRRYLRQNNISLTLSIRIQRFLDYAYTKSKANDAMSSIHVFKLLSDALRNELSCELALPQLEIHPLFKHLSDVALPTMQRLATHCISHKSLAHGDSLFYPGEQATNCYWVEVGRLQYIKMEHGPARTSDHNSNFQWVDQREDWIAEPILWTSNWVHLGVLMSTKETELLLVEPKQFATVISVNPTSYLLVQVYARNFLEWLNDQDDQNDIIQGEDCSDIIWTFIPIEDNQNPEWKNQRSTNTSTFRRLRSQKTNLNVEKITHRP